MTFHLHGYHPPPVTCKLPSAYMITPQTHFCDHLILLSAILYLHQFYESFYLFVPICFEFQLKHIYSEYQNIRVLPSNYPITWSKTSVPDKFISGYGGQSEMNEIEKWISHQAKPIQENEYFKYRASSYFDYVRGLYYPFHLSFATYVEYWKVPTYTMFDIPRSAGGIPYKLVLIHSTCTDTHKSIDLSFVVSNYIHRDDLLIISPDVNVYDEISEKHVLAERFVSLPYLTDYACILSHTYEIHAIDSFIANLVFPLLFQEKLLGTNVNIYDKENGHRICLFDE